LPSEDTTTVDEPSECSVGIDRWEVIDGTVLYDDASLKFMLSLNGLNHSGSGDFTQDEFDMKTRTIADGVTARYDGVEYLTNKKVEIDAILNISEDYRSEEHTSELQSRENLVCRLLLEKKKIHI